MQTLKLALGACAIALSLNWGLALAQFDLLEKGKDLFGSSGDTGAKTGSSVSQLSTGEIGNGLKEALRIGSERVVDQVGQSDGYNADPAIHLPLPKSLKTVQSALQMAGMSDLLDDLELKLNRAAEAAAPKAKDLFWRAISDMTLEDVEGIYNGPDDSATRYFQGKMSKPLAKEMRPIVDESLSDVGAIKSYETAMGEYESLPFVPDAKANLTEHVIEKGMDGIFYYLAKEEAAIRQNPVKRTTDLLQRVFGAK
jgi:hypothetical protein